MLRQPLAKRYVPSEGPAQAGPSVVSAPAGLRSALSIGLGSRVLVAASAIVAAAAADPAGTARARAFDFAQLTHPFGSVANAILSPLARWDAVWYLTIAHHGYSDPQNTAFFPLYPLLVRLTAGWSSSPGALLVASYAVSIAAFCGALYLLHRLVELELGERVASRTLILLALFPGALFFGAPYSESLFLLLTVGSFYAARRGLWPWAGALAAAATATRNTGLALIVPLVILYLYGPREDRPASPARRYARLRPLHLRHRPRADMAWLALAPLGLAWYMLYLARTNGKPLLFISEQREQWSRAFGGPLSAVWRGARDGVTGFVDLLGGHTGGTWSGAGADAVGAGVQNVVLLAFLVFAVVATVGVFRRLPLAYGAYVVAALAIPLSYPVAEQPLMSLPRFLAVLFPLFMWLALRLRRDRSLLPVLAVSTLGLAVLTAEFATWHWIA